MRVLMHHKNFYHDFNSSWQLDYEGWSHLPQKTGFDGHSSSTFLEDRSPTDAEVIFVYTELLSPGGEKKALEQISRFDSRGDSIVVISDLSLNRIQDTSPFNPNQSLFSETEFPVFAEALQRVVSASRSSGHRTLYHPHLATGVQNFTDIERLTTHTDVNLMIDTAHMLYLKIFKLPAYLEEIRSRVQGLILHDYTPCVWVDCRRQQLPYLQALSTNVFSHPAENGVKVEKLRFLFEDLYCLLIAGEREPHLTETTAALRSSLVRIGLGNPLSRDAKKVV